MNSLIQRLEDAMSHLKAGQYQETVQALKETINQHHKPTARVPAQLKAVYQVAVYLIDPVNPRNNPFYEAFQSSSKSVQDLELSNASEIEEHCASVILSIGESVIHRADHKALDLCEVVSKLQPHSELLRLWYVIIYSRLGLAEKVFEHVSLLKKEGWLGIIIDSGFNRCLRDLEMEFEHPLLLWALDVFINDPRTRANDIGWIASRQLSLLFDQHSFEHLVSSRQEIDDQALTYLESCLKYLTVPVTELETQLTRLRSTIFTRCLSESPELNHQLFRLITAYGLKEFHHEYVWWRSEQEESQLQALTVLLTESELIAQLQECNDATTEEIALLVSLYAMYAPLTEIMKGSPALHQNIFREISLWPHWMHELLQVTLYHREQEDLLSDQLPILCAVNDHTSLAVKQMYEENPYPRWSGVTRDPSYTSMPYSEHLIRSIPLSLEVSYPYHDDLSVFIAGGGTGSHPLGILASEEFDDIQDFTVLDLSKASLGYAQRKALEYNLHHIKFILGDILNVEQLDRSFSLIESVGVIHHMKDPNQGLAKLRSLLKPQGLMVLGLYSQRAREAVSQFRRYAADHQLEASPEGLREVRHQLIHQEDSPIYQNFAGLRTFGDVWISASMLRDLVFHVQETCYTPLELKRLCKANRLRFLGFLHLSPTTIAQYRELFPNDPHMRSLDCWDQYEQLYPDTFKQMFHLVCQAR